MQLKIKPVYRNASLIVEKTQDTVMAGLCPTLSFVMVLDPFKLPISEREGTHCASWKRLGLKFKPTTLRYRLECFASFASGSAFKKV
jgi:hypothetical protein